MVADTLHSTSPGRSFEGLARKSDSTLASSAPDSIKQECGRDFGFLQMLAHYLIAEAQEALLWDWFHGQMKGNWFPSEGLERDQMEERYAWIGRLGGYLVTMHLARRVEAGNIDLTVQPLLSYQAIRKGNAAAMCFNIGAMIVALKCHARPGCFNGTDPALYDQFLEIAYGDRTQTSIAYHYDKAICHFVHPTRPNPDLLLAYFRRVAPDPRARTFQPRSLEEAFFSSNMCSDLAKALRNSSRGADADFIDTLTKRLDDTIVSLRRREQFKVRAQAPLERRLEHSTSDDGQRLDTQESTTSELLSKK